MAEHDNEAFRIFRERAYELAETGRFPSWEHVKRALQAEDFQVPGGEQRGAKLFRELITARCRRARAGAHPFPSLAALQANG
jgi:hypothetical protein